MSGGDCQLLPTCASQKRSYNKIAGGWDRILYKSVFLKTEPKLKMRMCLGMRVLGKMQDGFGRRSEPKFKGSKMLGKHECDSFWRCFGFGPGAGGLLVTAATVLGTRGSL